jgi:L-fuconolactonase
MTTTSRRPVFRATAKVSVTLAMGLLLCATGRAASPNTPGLFDGHLHLIADDTAKYPRAVGAPPVVGPAAAGQAVLVPGGLPPGVGGQSGGLAGNKVVKVDTDAARMVGLMDQAGVVAAAAVQKKGTYGFDNRYTLDASDQFQQRFVSVAVLNAEDTATPARIQDMVVRRGLGGVRLTGGMSANGEFPWLSSPQALKSWEALNANGLVADLMVSDIRRPVAGLIEFAKLADKYPNVRIVLDHAGYPPRTGGPDFGIDAAHVALAAHRNIYLKFTIINLDLIREAGMAGTEAAFVRRLVDVYGADRILWGSDAGNSSGSYAGMIARIVQATARLTAAERQAVLHDTGRHVYQRGGLPPKALAATPVSVAVPGMVTPPAAAPFHAPPAALALEAAQAAIAQCRANGYFEVAAAVVGADGELRVLLADEATPPGHAVRNSERKAATAIAFKTSTAGMLARTRSEAGLAEQIEANPDWLARAGGQLLMAGGEAIGAIGVSGAPGGDKDDVCALAGVARIASRL